MNPTDLSPETLQIQATLFLDQIFEQVTALGFQMELHWDIDHLCFRVKTEEEYKRYKSEFSKWAHLLIESQVNGRAISTFELKIPIKYRDWLIKVVELPAPKIGKEVQTGFEHIEVVVDQSLVSFSQRYPGLAWDESGLSKILNAELEWKLNCGSIKFHHQSLVSIINLEKRPKIAMLIFELQLFETFADHHPFIAGTIPLAIDSPESDIDFLVTFDNPKEFKARCQKLYSAHEDFEIASGQIDGTEYALCRFFFKDTAFEIFCSDIITYNQNAFQHFQIEEKLLKYGPPHWITAVSNLKGMGLKTEPAFAWVLKYKDMDSYKVLLDLQKKPISELRQIIHSAAGAH